MGLLPCLGPSPACDTPCWADHWLKRRRRRVASPGHVGPGGSRPEHQASRGGEGRPCGNTVLGCAGPTWARLLLHQPRGGPCTQAGRLFRGRVHRVRGRLVAASRGSELEPGRSSLQCQVRGALVRNWPLSQSER